MRIRAILSCLLATLTMLAVQTPVHAISVSSTDPTPVAKDLGLAVPGTRLLWGEPAQVEADLDRIAASGATWLRFDVAWSQMSWVRGQIDFTRVDRVVAGAKARNLKVLGIVGTMAPYARPTGSPVTYAPRTDAERSEFAGFARQVATRYSGRVAAWEVWNEPNLDQAWSPTPSVDSYAKLLAVTSPALKSACGTCTVVAGGTGGAAGSPDIETYTWYQGLYAAGAHRYVDAIGVHPYTDMTSGYGGEMRLLGRVRNLMDANGDQAKAMWATETGAPTKGDASVSESDLGELMRESVDSWQAIPRRGPLFWYTLQDTADPSREGHFGLFRQDGTPKPAFATLQALTSGARLGQSPSPAFMTATASSAGMTAGVRTASRKRSSARAVATAPVGTDGTVSVLRADLSSGANYTTAQATLRTDGLVGVDAVIMAVRASDGSNRDVWMDQSAVLNGTQVFSGSRESLSAGTYTYRVAYRDTAGRWFDLAPEQTLVVGSATTASTTVGSIAMTASAQRAKGMFTLHTTGRIPVRMVLLAIRDSSGRGGYDALASFETTLSGYQTFFPSRQALPKGTYTYRVAYQRADGGWAEVAPTKTLIVN